MKLKALALPFVALALAAALPARAETEIQWWHAMGGPLGEWVNDLAKGFKKARRTTRSCPRSRAATPRR